MNPDAVKTVTLLLLAAFAVDCSASAVTFFSSRPKLKPISNEEAARQAWNQRLLYFVVASAIALAILAVAGNKIPLFAALGLVGEQTQPTWKDWCLAFIILVGGADRISSIVKLPGRDAGKEDRPEPLEVRGTLTLYDRQTEADEPQSKPSTAAR
jgi:hypothetical protein